MNDAVEAPDDATLLRQYANGAEPAFRELVRRHLGMVHGTARRVLTAAPHLADDITQNVFTDLARKAPSLPDGVVLGGWLHRHTCYLALNAMRAEHRRRQRESIAMEMQSLHAAPTHDEAWQKLAPVLDEALNGLPAADRDAIVLRYLQQASVRRVAAALNVTDDAAQKRIARALEKLRGLLTRRGITLPWALLAATLETGAASAPASAGLAASISATALNHASGMTSMLAPFKAMLSSKVVIGGLAALAVAGLLLVLVAQNRAPVAPFAAAAHSDDGGLSAQSRSGASAPVASPTGIDLRIPGNGATGPAEGRGVSGPDLAGGTALLGPDPFAQSAPATAAAVASEEPDGGMDEDPNLPVRWLTVTDGELTMTTRNADGTVSTVPYEERGATVTITPGADPNTHVLTFRDEDDGKILARITGVPEAPPDGPAPLAPVE